MITEAAIRVTTDTTPEEVIEETNETDIGVIIDMTIARDTGMIIDTTARDIGAIIDTIIAIEWDPSETGTEELELHHVTVAIVTDREQPPAVGTKGIRRNRPYFPHCHRKSLYITMKSLTISYCSACKVLTVFISICSDIFSYTCVIDHNTTLLQHDIFVGRCNLCIISNMTLHLAKPFHYLCVHKQLLHTALHLQGT